MKLGCENKGSRVSRDSRCDQRRPIVIMMGGRHADLSRLLLLQQSDGRRGVLASPSREASFPLLPFFVELTGFYLLPTRANKTNKKPKDYITKRTKK